MRTFLNRERIETELYSILRFTGAASCCFEMDVKICGYDLKVKHRLGNQDSTVNEAQFSGHEHTTTVQAEMAGQLSTVPTMGS